jgi:hypothetical protein
MIPGSNGEYHAPARTGRSAMNVQTDGDDSLLSELLLR